jgi:hypothetical protein
MVQPKWDGVLAVSLSPNSRTWLPCRGTAEQRDELASPPLDAGAGAALSKERRIRHSGPFYGFNRPDRKPSQAVILNWWRQGMMGGAKAQYDETSRSRVDCQNL